MDKNITIFNIQTSIINYIIYLIAVIYVIDLSPKSTNKQVTNNYFYNLDGKITY